MAGRSNVRRSFRSSGRKLSVWLGASGATPLSIASGTFAFVEMVSNASLTAVGFQGHLARTRGFIACRPNTAAQDPMITWGLGVFDIGLTVASQFPDPAIEPRDPYFAWGAVYGGSSTLFDIRGGQTMRVDSKGKRRYLDSDRIVLVVREVGSGHTALAHFDFDMLIIPDQG